MKAVIEKNVPLPTNWRKGDGGMMNEYPVRDMRPGDSFMLTGDEAKRVVGNIYNWARDLGMKFSVRRISKDGYRIWRVA